MHMPIRSFNPVEGYKHKCFFSSSLPCPSWKRSTTRLSNIFWSAFVYARWARFLRFSANSSFVSLRRLVHARNSAWCASSRPGESYLRDRRHPVVSSTSRLACLLLGLSAKIPGVPLFLPLSSIGGARWPQTGLSTDGIVRTLFHRIWEPWGSKTDAIPNCSFHCCWSCVGHRRYYLGRPRAWDVSCSGDLCCRVLIPLARIG